MSLDWPCPGPDPAHDHDVTLPSLAPPPPPHPPLFQNTITTSTCNCPCDQPHQPQITQQVDEQAEGPPLTLTAVSGQSISLTTDMLKALSPEQIYKIYQTYIKELSSRWVRGGSCLAMCGVEVWVWAWVCYKVAVFLCVEWK